MRGVESRSKEVCCFVFWLKVFVLEWGLKWFVYCSVRSGVGVLSVSRVWCEAVCLECRV